MSGSLCFLLDNCGSGESRTGLKTVKFNEYTFLEFCVRIIHQEESGVVS